MMRIILALILLALVAYALARRVLIKLKIGIVKCATCGRTLSEHPVTRKFNGEKLLFCCENCAEMYGG